MKTLALGVLWMVVAIFLILPFFFMLMAGGSSAWPSDKLVPVWMIPPLIALVFLVLYYNFSKSNRAE